MRYSLAFHLIGIVLWLGGLMILTRLMKALAHPSPNREPVIKVIGRVWKGFVLIGLVIATITGAYQLLQGGVALYMKQGWFHGKLTMLIVLFVVTFVVGLDMKKLQAGQELSPKRLSALHALSSLSLLVIVFLTMVGR